MDKVTRQCPQTTTFSKRKESRSGIEPRSFRLPASRLTARPNRLKKDTFYTCVQSKKNTFVPSLCTFLLYKTEITSPPSRAALHSNYTCVPNKNDTFYTCVPNIKRTSVPSSCTFCTRMKLYSYRTVLHSNYACVPSKKDTFMHLSSARN